MGRKVYSVKLKPLMVRLVDRELQRFKVTRHAGTISRNAFFERAILHELKHLKRSRSRRKVV